MVCSLTLLYLNVIIMFLADVLRDIKSNRRNLYKLKKTIKGLYHLRFRDFDSCTDLDNTVNSY